MTAYRPNKMLMRSATVVQVLQDLFKFYCMFYFTCDRSLSDRRGRGLDGNYEEDSLVHSKPMETDKRVSDVIVPANPNDEPRCSILSRLQRLYE